jgi:hypothetical protein
MLALQGYRGDVELGCKRHASRAVSAAILVTAVLAAAACGSDNAPAQPSSSTSLSGRWTGSITGRTPCVGVWTTVAITVTDGGAAELVTADGQHFGASEVVENGVRRFDVSLPAGQGECGTIQLVISSIDRDSGGAPVAFSGDVMGRCCGTLSASFRFVRAS